jgi:hypothetical protein
MNTSTSTKKKDKFHPHVHLENLIKNKFGLFIEVNHRQFDPPTLNFRDKPIRARTTVRAFKSIEDAKNFFQKKGVFAVAGAISECSIHDNFVKRVGLQKALHRLYREISQKVKESQ